MPLDMFQMQQLQAQRDAEVKKQQELATIQNQDARMKEAELEAARIKNEMAKKDALLRDDNYKRQTQLDQSRVEREKDLAEGRTRGEQLFGEGSLGRTSQEVMDRRKAEAGGFSLEEQNAMRENNLSTINQANAGNIRATRIAQAAQGVRGGQAVAQLAKMKNEQGGQIAGSERELFLKNIDARRAGLENLDKAQTYDRDMGGREKLARIATEMGYGSLGSADRGAVIQGMIGEKQAEAAGRSGGGGKK